MRIANSIVAAVAFLAVSGSARAEASLIRSNYVDDFGSLAPGAPTAATPSGSSSTYASVIPSNYVDDFGPLAPSPKAVASPAGSSKAHASLIPSNYVDDFGNDFGAVPSAPSERTATARAQPSVPSSDSSGS